MRAMYGKARVGQAVVDLAESLWIQMRLVDDADAEFDANAYECVIPTPGIPPRNRAYAAKNTLSELDFAYRYLPKGFTIIGITGTDGKSTTSWIMHEILRQEFWEEHVFLSGNFEIPFSETVREIREKGLKRGYIVIEISSFMANGIGTNPELLNALPAGERVGAFAPDYSIFTNFETDHVDWHGSVEEYFQAKMNLVKRTSKRIVAHESLLNKSVAYGSKFPENTRWYGISENLPDRTDGNEVFVSWRKKYALSDTGLTWKFNALNLLAAVCVGNELGICSKRISSSIQSISGLPHRIEYVATKNGVRYIDDSKSTSAQSLRAALDSDWEWPVILIAGGSDKGDSFDHLASLMKAKLKYLVCIGATREQFSEIAIQSGIPWAYADSMQEAVAKASQIATLGDVVLLSPGCASFWLFKNYLDRAHQFIQAVQSISE